MKENSNYRLIKLSNGDEIALLGTAHVSEQSVKDVEQAIAGFRPQNVCVELDERRLASLEDKEGWRRLDLGAVLKRRQGFLLLANLALSGYQRKIGEQTGSQPGEEMLKAVELARVNNLELTLCDREVAVTLRRAWAKSGFMSKVKILAGLVASGFEKEAADKAAIEALKESDNLSTMMNDLAKEAPVVKEVLIDERDEYLAKKIYEGSGRRLAVLGAGHLNGVESIIKELDAGTKVINEENLNIIPKAPWYSKALQYIIPAVVVALIVFGFIRGGAGTGGSMTLIWLLANGIPAAVGALVALAHPVTIVVSFLAAPFTTLNPAVSVGMVAGLVEIFIKKPTVRDFETLSGAFDSVKTVYRNRVTRILLVFILSSMGSALGTWIGFFKILSLS
jgi:pheromone shutdown-related protein TraB